MREPAWAGTAGFLFGVGAEDLEAGDAPLPEAVEDQLRKALANIHAIASAQGLDWPHVAALRINLTQYSRFHVRVERALGAYLAQLSVCPQTSLIGIEMLPREALVNVDAILKRV